MNDAFIVAATRTPAGRRGGMLAQWRPVDLLAATLRSLLDGVALTGESIDDVIGGCVSEVGEQSLNIARHAALAAGFPSRVPGTTIDRQCGSSQQALAFAAQGIAAGAYECVIACGVESMSRVPLGSSYLHGPGEPPYRVNQGVSAEKVAQKWHLTRADLDAYALESHRRAAAARNDGAFRSQVTPIDGNVRDEGIREDTSLEALAALKPAFLEGGKITAGNASQISDGAAAILVCSGAFAAAHGLPARARVLANTVVGDDPDLMLTAPIPATAMVLERAGLSLRDIDRFEVNEAFASVVLAWQRDTGADLARVNVNGGAIALGHPLGATGARLTTILLHELERCEGRYGLQVMCEGGGMANATIIERIES
ncbi:MAG TPA: thiolase family protein [Candidatus Baltobacteraceae bacterium]|nr:thiolase family protein [Candidatus Baltobacteraceae bacterium]